MNRVGQMKIVLRFLNILLLEVFFLLLIFSPLIHTISIVSMITMITIASMWHIDSLSVALGPEPI